MYSKLTMNDVDVDVIIDRRKAYGLADGKPFYARIASTSSYLGCGHSYWEVTGDFTAPEKRIIARALWKTMESEQEKGNIKFYKQWTVKDSFGFKCRKDIQIDLPGRK
jgi:hypothetical protein